MNPKLVIKGAKIYNFGQANANYGIIIVKNAFSLLLRSKYAL